MKLKKLLFLGLIISSYAIACCQEIDSLKPSDVFNLSLEEMLKVKVNVSSTIPTDVFNSPSTVTVIDRELINQFNYLTVAEAIRQIAGVEILQTVIDKNVPTFRGILQNFYANKVLVMINNVPVWNPTYGNTSIDRIAINDVDRIEVLKGPASVLYGTNAYAGVINIITLKPDDTELHAQIDAGMPDIGLASINYGQNKGDFKWTVSASTGLELRNPYLIKGGADTLKIENSTIYDDDTLYYYREELRKNSFYLDLNYKSHSLYVNNFINSYTNPGVNATYKTGANRSINDKGTLLSYAFDHNFSKKTHFIFNTYYDYHYRNQIMSQADALAARYKSYRVAATAKINHSISEKIKAEFGGEIFNGHSISHEIVALTLDTIVSENIKKGSNLTEGSVFGQLNYHNHWFNILAGARYTYNKNFGSNLSPRISTLFAINQENKIKLVYGQSYRTPNLLELYFNHWSVIGNPNLEPETNSTLELSYLTKTKYLFAQVTAYHSYYKNLIQRIRTSDIITDPAQYRNSKEFQGYGIEFELKYQNPKVFNANLNYNFCDGNTLAKEENFKYVPSHTLAIGINKPIKQFFLSSNGYLYSETSGHEQKIPAQLLLDIHAGYKHKSAKNISITHTISAKNISNSDMLIPEYIRQRPGVNALATTGFGSRIIYSLKIEF